MKKVLIIVDKPNWAYDSIAKSLLKYISSKKFIAEIDYIKNSKYEINNLNDNFDLFFFIGWQSIIKKNFFGNYQLIYPNLDKKKIICGIHSHHSWDKRKSMPNKIVYPEKKLIDTLNSLNSINLVSSRLFNIFKDSGLKNGHLTFNGVDTEIFSPEKRKVISKYLRVGYSGSKKHDWRKGITEFIIPASNLNNVKLYIAAPQINYVSHEMMADFYNEIDLYLCASSSEGFSLSVLEALACGIPVISTNVGGCEEIIKNGKNGFLVDRNVEDFKKKIIYFQNKPQEIYNMGKNARQIIEKNWSWKIRVDDWYKFILNSLNLNE